MNAGDLFKILKDNFSSGTLSPDDNVIVENKEGDTFTITSAECSTQTCDFIIVIEDY